MKFVRNAARHLVYKIGTIWEVSGLFRFPGLPQYETDRQRYRR